MLAKRGQGPGETWGTPTWRGGAGAAPLGVHIYITHTKFAYTFVQFLVQET
jgi:hypothetical protein